MKIKEYLRSEYLSVSAFCKRARMNPQTLYQYMKGGRDMTAYNAWKIYMASDGKVAIEDIMRGDELEVESIQNDYAQRQRRKKTEPSQSV